MSTKINVNCRFSYLHCWEPASINGNAPKYSVSAIVSKKDTKTLDSIKAAIAEAKKAGAPKWGGKIPDKLTLPLHDGDIDKPGDPAYHGCYYFNASTSDRPQVVDANREEILDKSEMYSGCYGRISVTFYPYAKGGNRGVGASLGHFQKLRDGEPLGGVRASAADDFADEDEDFLA